MKLFFKYNVLLFSAAFQVGCSGGQHSTEPTSPSPDTPSEKKLDIKISPSVIASRATDYGFETGDCIGLYVVNYSGSTPGSLSNSGNHVDNMRFSYNGIWTSDKMITWADNTTNADFYLYYPYANIQNVAAHSFSVKADQSTEAAYKASDLMAGKVLNVAPSAEVISIPVNHAMSRITISLEAGNGFTAESLAKADIAVKINGVKCDATLNIASGAVSAIGESTTVTPQNTGNEYKALIVPQTVEEGNLITVTVDGRDFNLRKAFTFESAKSHKFAVTISKISTGVNVNINPWIEDGEDNGGTAE